MRLSLIGAGRIGSYHAGILARLPEVEGLVIADAVPSRAEDVAAGVPHAVPAAVGDAFVGVDAVVIASSTDTHAELLMRAAAAALPAFCEKPIALDLESTRRAVDAIDAAGITVQMGFQRRYDPAIRAIREAVVDGRVGTPYLVRSQTHDPAPPPLEYIPVSGGIFRDCLIHDIDAVRYVTGQDVVSVRAVGAVIGFPEIGELGDVDSAAAMLEMSEGTIAQLSGLRHDPVGYDVRLEIFGPVDSMVAGWSDRAPIHSAEPGSLHPHDPIVSMFDRFEAAYHAEMAAFVRVVDGEERPAGDHHDAYEALRVAVACDRSLAEDRTVTLDEIT